MKKFYFVLIIIGILILGWLFIRFVLGGDEDSWIKDEKGVFIKHGNPVEIPDNIQEQQAALSCANNLYQQVKFANVELSSQCLGNCEDFAVDIVHVPRTAEDNLLENQCEDYRTGNISHFIELDKDGEIVKIV